MAVTTSTRLLDDLLTSLIGGPGLSLCVDASVVPLVSVVTPDRTSAARGRVAIVLADRIEDPIRVYVDGRPALSAALGPDRLRELILGVAHQLTPLGDPLCQRRKRDPAVVPPSGATEPSPMRNSGPFFS